MKKTRFLCALLAIAAVDCMAQVSSSDDGYGVKAYAAGAVAASGLAAGLAHKFYKRGTGSAAVTEGSNATSLERQKKLDKVINDVQGKMGVHYQLLRNQLNGFLKSAGKAYDACDEYKDKFDEIIFKLKEITLKIQGSGIRRSLNAQEAALLANVTSLLGNVESARTRAINLSSQLDQDYNRFIQSAESRAALCFNDAKMSAGQQQALRLPDESMLQQAIQDIKNEYVNFSKQHETLSAEYTRLYGSYTERAIDYVSSWWNKTEQPTAQTMATPAPVAPVVHATPKAQAQAQLSPAPVVHAAPKTQTSAQRSTVRTDDLWDEEDEDEDAVMKRLLREFHAA